MTESNTPFPRRFIDDMPLEELRELVDGMSSDFSHSLGACSDEMLREFIGSEMDGRTISANCLARGKSSHAEAWKLVYKTGSILAVAQEWLRRKESQVATPYVAPEE